MSVRIFSRVARRSMMLIVATSATVLCTGTAAAQEAAGYYTDPATGIVYRKVTKTIERPVVETQMATRQQTIYRPQTVTESKPESRTVFTPVVEYQWEPRLKGRWNPFQQPSVVYEHTPRTSWESRSEVVQRTNTRTEWVAENRTVEVPQQSVRMAREQKVDYEAVGRVAPPQADPPGASEAIASRLRPLASNTTVAPLYQGLAGSTSTAPRIASTSVGRMTSDPPRRSRNQGGMRTTDLYRTAPSGYGRALPPTSSGIGVAVPSLPLWR